MQTFTAPSPPFTPSPLSVPPPSPLHLPAVPPELVGLCEGGGRSYFAGGLHRLFELCYAILPGDAPTVFTAKAGLLVTFGPPPPPGERRDESDPLLLGRMVRPVRMGDKILTDKRATSRPLTGSGGGGDSSDDDTTSVSSSRSRSTSLFGRPPPKAQGGATVTDPEVVWWEVGGWWGWCGGR